MPGSFTVFASLHWSFWQVSVSSLLPPRQQQPSLHCVDCIKPLLGLSPLQSVYVFHWEPCLQGQTLHHPVPTHGLVLGSQRACRHLPDAGDHALPGRLLHLPDKVGQRGTRVLHESESLRDEVEVMKGPVAAFKYPVNSGIKRHLCCDLGSKMQRAASRWSYNCVQHVWAGRLVSSLEFNFQQLLCSRILKSMKMMLYMILFQHSLTLCF